MALTNNIDRPAKHPLPLAKLTNLSSSGNWGDFVDYRPFLQSMYYFKKKFL